VILLALLPCYGFASRRVALLCRGRLLGLLLQEEVATVLYSATYRSWLYYSVRESVETRVNV
jgi:hypothetical protein